MLHKHCWASIPLSRIRSPITSTHSVSVSPSPSKCELSSSSSNSKKKESIGKKSPFLFVFNGVHQDQGSSNSSGAKLVQAFVDLVKADGGGDEFVEFQAFLRGQDWEAVNNWKKKTQAVR